MAAVVTLKWSEYEEGAETGTLVYEVTDVSTVADAINEVATQEGMTVNSAFPGRPLLKAQAPFGRTPKGPLLFEVWFRFTIPAGGGDHPTPGTDPLLEPPDIQWTPLVTSDPVVRDIDGNALLYPSREPIQNQTRDVVTWEVQIRRNESFFNFLQASDFSNTVNLNAMTLRQPNGGVITFTPGSIKCKIIAPVESFKTTATYVKMGYTLEFRQHSPWFAVFTYNTSPFHIHEIARATRGFYDAGSLGTYTGNIVYAESGKQPDDAVLTGETGIPLETGFKIEKGENDLKAAIAGSVPTGVFYAAGPAGAVTPKYLVYKNYPGRDFSPLNL